jgi:hypothetical protein
MMYSASVFLPRACARVLSVALVLFLSLVSLSLFHSFSLSLSTGSHTDTPPLTHTLSPGRDTDTNGI